MNRKVYDEGNLVEEEVDNGDGTGTLTDFTTDPPTVTQLTDLPIYEPPPPSPEDRITVLEADLAAALALLNGEP